MADIDEKKETRELTVLVDAYRSGNQAAFGRIYELTKDNFHSYADLLLMAKDNDDNIKLAVDMYNKSADQGNRYAMYSLGKVYESGLLKDASSDKLAIKYFDMACSITPVEDYEDDTIALRELIVLLAKKHRWSKAEQMLRTAEHYNISIDEYIQDTINNNFKALSNVRKIIDFDINNVDEATINNLEQEAAANDTAAIDILSCCYCIGIKVTQDKEKAIALLELACERNDRYAMFRLGDAYLLHFERYGIEENYEQAKKYIDMAYDISPFEEYEDELPAYEAFYNNLHLADLKYIVDEAKIREAKSNGSNSSTKLLQSVLKMNEYYEYLKFENHKACYHALCAEIYNDMGEYEKALSEIEKADSVVTDLEEVNRLGMYICENIGMTDRAIEFGEKLLVNLGDKTDQNGIKYSIDVQKKINRLKGEGSTESKPGSNVNLSGIQKYSDELRVNAESGDVNSQRALAMCYFNGDGVSISSERAIYWFKHAADQNDRYSLYMLAKLGADITSSLKLSKQQVVDFSMKAFMLSPHESYEQGFVIADSLLEYFYDNAMYYLKEFMKKRVESNLKNYQLAIQNFNNAQNVVKYIENNELVYHFYYNYIISALLVDENRVLALELAKEACNRFDNNHDLLLLQVMADNYCGDFNRLGKDTYLLENNMRNENNENTKWYSQITCATLPKFINSISKSYCDALKKSDLDEETIEIVKRIQNGKFVREKTKLAAADNIKKAINYTNWLDVEIRTFTLNTFKIREKYAIEEKIFGFIQLSKVTNSYNVVFSGNKTVLVINNPILQTQRRYEIKYNENYVMTELEDVLGQAMSKYRTDISVAHLEEPYEYFKWD